MFKRKRPVHSVSITDEGISIKTQDVELLGELVSFWATLFVSDEPKEKVSRKAGFSTEHMREVDSDTEITRPEVEAFDDDEDEDD